MEQNKFLTVFAVYDDETQAILKKYQDSVINATYSGTQTMNIPFHVTLGSFPVECEKELIDRIKLACNENFEFDINFSHVGHFNNKVLFIEPEYTEQLMNLHALFDNNYPYGFPYHAHTTIFCGEEQQVIKAKAILTELFESRQAKIVGIQMGEFFPTRMIVARDLQKH